MKALHHHDLLYTLDKVLVYLDSHSVDYQYDWFPNKETYKWEIHGRARSTTKFWHRVLRPELETIVGEQGYEMSLLLFETGFQGFVIRKIEHAP